jgi:hypothetical protein
MHREGALLLGCSGVQPAGKYSTRLKTLLAESLDWPWIVAMARLHGLGPLLYSQLSANGSGRLEPTLLQSLRESFQRDVRRSFLMSQELLAILELFSANQIPALPYKGPVLAAAEYGNIAHRPCCDLDILIHPENLASARDLLMARGYVPEHQLTPLHERAWLRARNDINLRRPDLDIVVELHWEVVPRRLGVRFDDHRLWEKPQTVRLGGRDVQTLSAENLLLLLCVHGAKHGWTRLMWIRDVAAIVANHPDINWPALFREARRMGVERMLTVGLHLASNVAGCALPDEVRGFTQDPATTALAAGVRERLFESPDGAHSALERSLFHLKIRERLRDKVRFAFYTAIVPNADDRLLVGLPPALTVFYFLLRPFRLLRKHWWPDASKSATLH